MENAKEMLDQLNNRCKARLVAMDAKSQEKLVEQMAKYDETVQALKVELEESKQQLTRLRTSPSGRPSAVGESLVPDLETEDHKRTENDVREDVLAQTGAESNTNLHTSEAIDITTGSINIETDTTKQLPEFNGESEDESDDSTTADNDEYYAEENTEPIEPVEKRQSIQDCGYLDNNSEAVPSGGNENKQITRISRVNSCNIVDQKITLFTLRQIVQKLKMIMRK